MYQVHRIASLVAGGDEQLREKPFISMSSGYCISPFEAVYRSLADHPGSHQVGGSRSPCPALPCQAPTRPMTMAGTLAQVHAEQLAGITPYARLWSRDAAPSTAPYPAWPTWGSMGYVGGAIEHGMMNAAHTPDWPTTIGRAQL